MPSYAWFLIAAAVTPLHIAVMRWAMPTPSGKKSVSFIPVVLGATLLLFAVVKSYSVATTLYFYSATLLIFVVMVAPVRNRVAADILKQEQNPDIKVKLNTLSLVWVTFSMLLSIGVVVGVWAANT
ncbi:MULTISPECIES: hypothetical protein [unclassified Streptomyces]|uniref:hypothetical protein n=1 Tax=unclassified Streptomyces TaxID=2593676 RepID=UPI003D759A43